MAGGNSGGVVSFLPIAAALAATVATDGAASPWLVEAMGSEAAAGAVLGAGAGALGGGITAGLTGQNVGKSALMGGISGATLGYGMAPADAAAGAGTTAPLTGSNVAGTVATPLPSVPYTSAGYSGVGVNPATYSDGLNALNPAGIGLNPQPLSTAVLTTPTITGGLTPVEIAAGQGTTTYGGLGVQGTTGANIPADYTPTAGSSGIMKLLSDNKGIAALGGTALLGSLINQSNKKYGTPTPASQQYNGPLNDFHYSRENYTPLTTAQPNPAYQPKYANYVAQPYNAYAAAGGKVVSMAQGGIADANPVQNPSVGSVEQMSRDNALGQNQMFPQANINSPAFASATNTPMGSNMIAAAGDTNVDPYTGAERFAEGGIADAPQTQPQGVPLQAMPNMLTQNAMNTNNNLTQDLVSRMAARNAMSPVPGQTPPVVPTGIMAAAPQAQAQQYQGYSAPTFTRPNVAPIEFQNPMAIVGTKPYNDEQARLAAEEAAKKAAQDALAQPYNPFGSSSGSGDGGGDGGGEAAGGLMQSYAAGGKTTSNMAAIDNYITQYQTDPTGPATVAAKAKSGDYNAMIAMNKIKGTPNQNYAAGGHLGSYSDGGRMLKGPGDGMSDNIPATIGGKQPARLADGEFVVPADVVSHLGNGSTDAGAKHLYAMMDKVRKARTGNKKQGKQIKADKYLKA